MVNTKKIIISLVTTTTLIQLLTSGYSLDRNFVLSGEVEKPPVLQQILVASNDSESDIKNVIFKQSLSQEIIIDVPKIETPSTPTPNEPVETTAITNPITPSSKPEVNQTDLRQKCGEKLYQYSDYDYFIDNYFERYVNYMMKNPSYSCEKIITYVNIGLDNPFYTNIKQINNPSSYSVLVNKYYQLPSDYVPSDLNAISSAYTDGNTRYLRKDACDAFEQMCTDAQKSGLRIFAVSTYRSYQTQESIYNNYVAEDGKAEADTYSARPGHTEHQTGLTVDVIAASRAANVQNTDEYAWYSKNAHKYGYIIRYTEAENVTGYVFEPWHLRYIGVDLATAVYESGLTYDEYCAQHIELLPDYTKDMQNDDKKLVLAN